MKLLKTIGVLILLILPVFIFKVPEYVELNDLAIIRGVGLSCQEEKVTLTLKEIIPIKGENGITYQYEYYQGESRDISGSYRKILDKTKKKLYLPKVKFLVTNCKNSDEFFQKIPLEDVKIYHVKKSVIKKLKETTL